MNNTEVLQALSTYNPRSKSYRAAISETRRIVKAGGELTEGQATICRIAVSEFNRRANNRLAR